MTKPTLSTPFADGESELHLQIEQLQSEAAAAREEIERLHQDVHRWWSVADQYRHELLVIHASKSWRITSPLRQASHVGQRLFTVGRHAANHFVRLPRCVAKAILLWAIRRVLMAPRLKAKAEMLLSGHPRFRQRLRNLLVAPANQIETPPATGSTGMKERLSTCAASIYAELQQSLAARER